MQIKFRLPVISFFIALIVSFQAYAVSLDWKGQYRFEWTQLNKPSLDKPSGQKAYALNYLSLNPQIIASDSVNVYSQFLVLPNRQYPGSQLGQVWGDNTQTPATSSTNQGESSIGVTELYVKVLQEYGVLTAGRAPFDFGIGMTYSSGRGEFDHWKTVKDLVSFKLIFGEWSVTPIISKVKASEFDFGKSVSTMGLVLNYDNQDTKTKMGIYHEAKQGSAPAVDLDPTQYGGSASARRTDLNVTESNLYFARDFSTLGFRLEAGFRNGGSGLFTAAGEEIQLGGYGIATEFLSIDEAAKFNWKVKAGIASGDNPDSSAFEGYAFNRNYDVAILLFNHRMGQRDFFGTNINKKAASGFNSADDEQIGNATYIAPSLNHRLSDKWEMNHTVIYAQLINTLKSSVDSTKDLGLEYDLEVSYMPTDRLKWSNSVGLLFPGSAWGNGTDRLGTQSTYGFVSRATISF